MILILFKNIKEALTKIEITNVNDKIETKHKLYLLKPNLKFKNNIEHFKYSDQIKKQNKKI